MKTQLVNGRHEVIHDGRPVYPYIYKQIQNVHDFEAVEREALEWLEANPHDEYDVFISGLSVATISVIKACQAKGAKLNMWHWDSVARTYHKQEVL